MSRKPGVRIFDENGNFHHFEKQHVAAQMEEAGMVKAVYEQRIDGPNFVGYRIHSAAASSSNHTQCSLTKSDMVINATAGRSVTKGLSDERRRRIDLSRSERGLGPLPEVDRIELVSDRVQFYPYEFDKKAPSTFNCKHTFTTLL